jgi:hypothetical protein
MEAVAGCVSQKLTVCYQYIKEVGRSAQLCATPTEFRSGEISQVVLQQVTDQTRHNKRHPPFV